MHYCEYVSCKEILYVCFHPIVSFYIPSFHLNHFTSCIKTFKSTTNLRIHLYKWSVAFKRHVRFRGANISICLVQHKDNGLAENATAASSVRRKWSWQSWEMEGTCIPLRGCNCIPPPCEFRGKIVLAQQIEAAGADADGRGGQERGVEDRMGSGLFYRFML